ncbi:MAG: T9SS type A sorting domain-containing protein, partial [Flavobacteriales bacterium]|nr:T9SS type A sorting domain-containing protein [Flavobacteriales bacterium]
STSNKHKVNTTNFNNGIYFYTISNNGNTITTNKFIVAK